MVLELLVRFLSVVAAVGFWLALLNRVMNHGTHGPVKTAMIALSGLLAWLVGLSWPGLVCAPWSYAVPLGIATLLGLGEIHRLQQRARAHARALFASTDARERLISTTALEVRRATVAGTGIGPLRVVHLSDLHAGHHLPFEYSQSALARCMAEKPDLILITGDFISRSDDLPLLRRLLVGALQARYGVYAVLGNHDYWTDPAGVRGVLEQAGIRSVAGTSVEIALEPRGKLVLHGTERPWGPGLDHAAFAARDAAFVLSHSPDNVYRCAELGADVVFSGHTHGGQFRIPRLGGLVVPSRYGRRFDRGRFRLGKTHLFVSSGVGIDTIPFRLFCAPDFLVVDFVDSEHLDT